MTAWALLALVRAGKTQSQTVQKGIMFLQQKQAEDGSWPAEHIAGVFNHTCGIHYDNYLKN